MKRFICICALALIVAGCNKQETTDTRASEAGAAEEPANEATTATDAGESAVPETELLEVVEESAAVAEDESGDQKILLARTDDVAVAARNWQFKEGQNFTRMIPTQPTVGSADKIEVAEVFMYSCPHCYDLEAYLNSWEEDKNPNVRFVRIPAVFNPLAQLHAQLYYTEVFLAKNGTLKDPVAFRNMVFDEFHNRSNRLTSEAAIQRLFVRAGVSEDDFNRTWKSFEVNQALRMAADLARRYNIMSVPTMIVNGKYRTDMSMAGGYPKLIELIDELTAREGLR